MFDTSGEQGRRGMDRCANQARTSQTSEGRACQPACRYFPAVKFRVHSTIYFDGWFYPQINAGGGSFQLAISECPSRR